MARRNVEEFLGDGYRYKRKLTKPAGETTIPAWDVVSKLSPKVAARYENGKYTGRFGMLAARKDRAKARSPRLLAFRSCIASRLAGKDYKDLADIQANFIAASVICSHETKGKGE